MLEHAFVTPAYKHTVVRNAYGDMTSDGNVTTYHCRIRENSQLFKDGELEEVITDATAWFPTTTPITENDIFEIDSIYYRVYRILKAKRLGETDIQFKKVVLQRVQPLVS